MVLTITLELSISVVDTIMLGQYSAVHLAAIGIASSLWLPAGCFLIGSTMGITPLITRHLHGRQLRLVNIYMSQALGMCIVIGILVSIITVTLLPYLAGVMATEIETRDVAIAYLYWFAPAMPMLALVTAYKNLFEAAGRPFIPLISVFIGLLLNIGMNYVFIYGAFGVAEMGAAGAALASSISLYFAVICLYGYDKFVNPRPLFTRIVMRYTRKFSLLFSIGAPAGLAFAFEICLFSSMTWLIAAFGDIALGAGQIVMSYNSLLFTPMMAMSSVAAIVVAKAMSQESVRGVAIRIRIIVALGLGYTTTCFVVTQIFYDSIPYLFSSNQQVVTIAASILLVSSWYQFPDMLQAVLTGTLRGLRDTRAAMIAFAVSLFGLSIPCGYWLAHFSPWAATLTVRGFYIGLGIGLTLLAGILIRRYYVVLHRYRGMRIRVVNKVA